MIPVKVHKISFHPPSRSYAVILKEIEGERRLPVIVGAFEAQSIALALEFMETPRPLTHDLVGNIIKGIDGKLNTIKITKLKDGVFYARLEISIKGTGRRSIDSRPSDALAIALRLQAPILVAESVMADAGMMPDIQGENEKELDISEWIPSLSSLEKKLRSAIDEEKYELAAKIRDQIKEMHT
ncbi:MAG: bifunctional nuclease domain-containing protein [Fidelibacterota bacterium]